MNAAVAALSARLAEPRPLVMGVLNVTPDSFSDGGRYRDIDAALEHAERMADEGADIIDIGGESTRPGAAAVDDDEERARVLPLLEALSQRLPIPLSVDTSKPSLMAEAGAAGCALINDVRALRESGAIEAVAPLDTLVCLMHMQGEPRTMQADPRYDDVVREVGDFLVERVEAAADGGVARERMLVDPGFGFGKTAAHNLSLVRHLDRLLERTDRPLLAGISRKRTIGTLLGGVPTEERLHGSVAAAVLLAERGARVLRVHDVRPTVEALAVTQAVLDAE